MLVDNVTSNEILHIQGKDVNLSWPIFSKILILEDCNVSLPVRQERVRVLVLYRCKISGSIKRMFPNLLVLDLMETESFPT
ncbi:MAG: hypothetical protein D6732_26300 [Methanobacteriota archaeon]|nr:MAG: hypothetical protein D6732_26300 [Euryarchaeota archaeon]